MFPEHQTNSGMPALGKEMLLIDEEMARWTSEDDRKLRSRHAGILGTGEVGSWYGWGDGEGMYLEGERGDWTGWGGGRLEESERLGEGANQDQTWEMYGLEEEGYTERFGEKEVEHSHAELEDILQRGGRRRRRRRRKRPETEGVNENAPPVAGGL